jgi:hypothetical protein
LIALRNTKLFFPVLAGLLAIAVAVLFPYCRYYVDPDATAYLTLARRYVSGDAFRAVNAYWSPLGVWLTALLHGLGMPLMAAAVLQNAAGSLALLWGSHRLFARAALPVPVHRTLLLAMLPLLVFAVYGQLFNDLWMAALLLGAYLVFTAGSFAERPRQWVLLGVLAALAYFAKAYALPYFVLQQMVLGYGLYRKRGKYRLRPLLIPLLAFVVVAMPWWLALYAHYGFWTTGTAGKLNLGWSLIGHAVFKPGFGGLLPPAFPDSPSYWEDPWLVNGVQPHWYDSAAMARLQVLRILYYGWLMLQNLAALSVCLPVLISALLILFVRRRFRRIVPEALRPAALQFFLFLPAFLLIHNEARYFWYLVPFGLLLLGWWWQQKQDFRPAWGILLVLSFWVAPVENQARLINAGKVEYQAARTMRQLNLSGSFTSNARFGTETQRMFRLAYFSGNPWYQAPYPDMPAAQFWREVRRYQIRYYVAIQRPGSAGGLTLSDETGRSMPEVSGGRMKGVRIFQLY